MLVAVFCRNNLFCSLERNPRSAINKVRDGEDASASTRERVRSPEAVRMRFWLSSSFVICSLRVETNSVQRLAHYRRGRRIFRVTLVVWNEDARQKYFKGGAAITR